MGTIIRAVLTYWFLLFMLRITGRRTAVNMTPFEMILIFVLGGISVSAIIADDHSVTNAWLAILTVSMMHVLVSVLKRHSSRFGQIADGTPVVILGQGRWHRERMQELEVTEQDVMTAARSGGIERIDQIKYAIVERNGSISIVKAEAA